MLESQAAGYESLVRSAGDAKSAATLLMIEKLEEIVSKQLEAIQNLKIDKITVWDPGATHGKGSSTSQFLSRFVSSLPPLQAIAKRAGVELPDYLGRVSPEEEAASEGPRR